MKETQVLEQLERVGPRTYVDMIRKKGRKDLDDGVRQTMSEAYVQLRALSRGDRLSHQTRSVIRNIAPVFQSEWKLASPRPPLVGEELSLGDTPGLRYQSYTNVRVLNMYLGTNVHTTNTALVRACWRAIQYLASTWSSYEVRTRLGLERWNQEHLVPDAMLAQRINITAEIAETAALETGEAHSQSPRLPETWSALSRSSHNPAFLEYLTVLPQTTFHDEVTFLRTIHLTEACFWGILISIISYMENLAAMRYSHAASWLEQATRFAEVQIRVLEAMMTMPPENFTDFRDDTGQASAVQSRTNHLMYIHLYGLLDSKADAIREIPENLHLFHYVNETFVTFQMANESLDPNHLEAPRIARAIRHLDKEMQIWRGKHLKVARTYLPAEAAGTGGTSGASYLQRFARQRFDLESPPTVMAAPIDLTGIKARPVLGWEN